MRGASVLPPPPTLPAPPKLSTLPTLPAPPKLSTLPILPALPASPHRSCLAVDYGAIDNGNILPALPAADVANSNTVTARLAAGNGAIGNGNIAHLNALPAVPAVPNTNGAMGNSNTITARLAAGNGATGNSNTIASIDILDITDSNTITGPALPVRRDLLANGATGNSNTITARLAAGNGATGNSNTIASIVTKPTVGSLSFFPGMPPVDFDMTVSVPSVPAIPPMESDMTVKSYPTLPTVERDITDADRDMTEPPVSTLPPLDTDVKKPSMPAFPDVANSNTVTARVAVGNGAIGNGNIARALQAIPNTNGAMENGQTITLPAVAVGNGALGNGNTARYALELPALPNTNSQTVTGPALPALVKVNSNNAHLIARVFDGGAGSSGASSLDGGDTTNGGSQNNNNNGFHILHASTVATRAFQNNNDGGIKVLHPMPLVVVAGSTVAEGQKGQGNTAGGNAIP